MRADDKIIVYPGACLKGRIRVPGDKSISHRLAILSALASGVSSIRGILKAGDCVKTVGALESLGAPFVFKGDMLEIEGSGGKWRKPGKMLDLGNSGTGIRLLAGLLAGAPITVELSGDRSLRSRPMGRIKAPLELMGATVELLGPDGCAPIRVSGGNLSGITYQMPVASAQVKSCILLASLFCRGVTRICELQATRDHTERLLRAMGVPVEIDGARITIKGYGRDGPGLRARQWRVPGDFSSAAFWLAAGASTPGARVCVEGVGLNPRRTGFIDILRRMGAGIEVAPEESSESPEPAGAIMVEGSGLAGTQVAGEEIPGVIDELPLVAVLGALASGTTTISGAAELRVKESDRIGCTAANLRLLGVDAEELPDGLIVRGGGRIGGNAPLDSYGDHRMAMAMAVLATHGTAPSTIGNVGCVDTSYPDFWRDMRSLGADVKLSRGN